MRQSRIRNCCFLLLILIINSAHAQDMPLHFAPWTIVLQKDINTVPPPHEPSDTFWYHLHRGHPSLPDSSSNTIAPQIINGFTELPVADSGVEMRYLVHDKVVSPWLQPPFRFELKIDNPAFAQLTDGVHDLSVEVRGPNSADFKPWRAFVHITRDKASGEPFGFDKQVPIITQVKEFYHTASAGFGPGVVYVDPADRNHVGFPVNSDVTPWQLPPTQAPLYQEPMGPHSVLFRAMQMWWDHPAHADAPFVRGMTPKHGEDHRFLRVREKHERFPMSDGPRGIAWMSPYVSGQVDSQGRLAFAEAGGRIGYLMPDGEIVTIAGWRVKPDKDPIWFGKPVEQVRQNMENRGNWTDGRGEFFTPLDIAIDPNNESIWYVVSYEDHVVWKVELPDDIRNQEATVSVFAGDPGHSAGSTDGNGQQARFNGPASIVFDPTNDVIYVADQDNDAIRRITRAGDVTTVFGQPGMQARITAAGADWTDQLAARSVSTVEVTAAQASSGTTPDIYLPQVIRVDSEGNIILLEIGYGAIRRIDPQTGVTKLLGEVRQKHRQFDRGWAWLDVDRYGNSGPKDGIYWCKFVSTSEDELFNEVYSWLPKEGGESTPLFTSATGLYPDGWGRLGKTNVPHYPWLVAVDPRGALLMSGGGEHGITRLRIQKDDDPIESEDYWLGRKVYESGSDEFGSYPATSFSLKYGYNGHNQLGFTNAWSLTDASDEELLDAFEVPNRLRDDPVARQQWLNYVRPNTHTNADSTQPPPPPTDVVPPLTLPNASWQQFSLPCDPGDNNSVAALFGDDNLGEYGSDWIIWAFDGATNSYQDVNEQTAIEPGRGYWIVQQSGETRQLKVPASCTTTAKTTSAQCPAANGCFAAPLVGPAAGSAQTGQYQMIGYPFTYEGSVVDTYVSTESGSCSTGCVVGSTEANDILEPVFWNYNGTSYDERTPSDQHSPWLGYWVQGLQGATDGNAQILFGQSRP